MFKVLLLTMIAVSGGLFASQTPEASHYRLVEPSIDAYLEVVPDVMTEANADSFGPSWVQAIIDTEFFARYPDPLLPSFDTLFSAYQGLISYPHTFNEPRPRWNRWLLLNWIDENNIHLETVGQFEFEDYVIKVSPRDFNVDGEPEWVLDIHSPEFSQIMIAHSEGQSYRLIDTPLPYFGANRSGLTEEQLFEDLNRDGLPEWVLAVGGYGSNNMSSGYLVILNWHEGQLVDVSPKTEHPWFDEMWYEAPAGSGQFLFPYGVSLTFEDDDDDGTREILIYQEQFDNWGCTWTIHRVFGWQGDVYWLIRSERVWDNVRGCEIRAAEKAMWERDYVTAIEHYERAFTLSVPEIRYVEYELLDRYVTVRLALAYTLVGRDNDAAAVSEELSLLPDERSVFTTLIPAITENLGNARAMCLAAYDAFSFECLPGTDACLGSPIRDLTIGMTLENPGDLPNSPRNGFPLPSRAGCDPAEMTPTPFPTYALTTPEPTTTPDYDREPYASFFDAIDAIHGQAYEQAVSLLDRGLSSPALEDDMALGIGYLRAVTLEKLERPDEALEQYVVIYESVPHTSAWGMLAGLHLEPLS